MIIEYYQREVYGRKLMYAKDPTTAYYLQALTGRQTLSAYDMEALNGLGFEFKEVLPS